MSGYLSAIGQGLVFFPLAALLLTLPYIAWNYRRYGSVLSLRILIVYSFILYLICAYCLVIFPLPSGAEAAALSGHRMQLVPFSFLAPGKPGAPAVFRRRCGRWLAAAPFWSPASTCC